jgi:hypothetical protein
VYDEHFSDMAGQNHICFNAFHIKAGRITSLIHILDYRTNYAGDIWSGNRFSIVVTGQISDNNVDIKTTKKDSK